jgi:hypothetical protein
MSIIHKIFPPRIVTRQMIDDELKKFTENLDYEQKNHFELLKRTRDDLKKQQNQSRIFLIIAGTFFLIAVLMYLYEVPVPSESRGIWIWRGLAALGFLIAIIQNLLDGPFMKTFRFAKLQGKTLVLIRRGDGKWGWISDDLRARAVTNEIYGEYAVTPGSLAMVDGVPLGFADESQGITLPTYLLRLAQEMKVHNILDYGTLDSIGNIEKKIDEYEEMNQTIKKNIEDNKDKITADELENIKIAQTNVQNVLEYLNTIKTNFQEVINVNKYTFALKPLLDFIPTMANNPVFKKTSRERAISMEKAKSNRGEDTMKYIIMFCMVVGIIAFAIYLVRSGQAESLVQAGGSAAKAGSTGVPQGVS